MAVQQDNNAILDKVYDALNRHDVAGVVALATDDVIVEDVPRGHTAAGRTAVEHHYRDFFSTFPDVRYTSLNRIQQGDTMVDEWVIRGTNLGELHFGKMVIAPTNQCLELHGVNVFEFSGGRVRRQRLYYDALTFARQLGLIPLLRARAAGQ